jgi:hypothetical protein
LDDIVARIDEFVDLSVHSGSIQPTINPTTPIEVLQLVHNLADALVPFQFRPRLQPASPDIPAQITAQPLLSGTQHAPSDATLPVESIGSATTPRLPDPQRL